MKNCKPKFLFIFKTLLLLVFIASLSFAVFYFIDDYQSQKNLKTLAQELNIARSTVTNNETLTDASLKQTDFPNLLQQNIEASHQGTFEVSKDTANMPILTVKSINESLKPQSNQVIPAIVPVSRTPYLQTKQPEQNLKVIQYTKGTSDTQNSDITQDSQAASETLILIPPIATSKTLDEQPDEAEVLQSKIEQSKNPLIETPQKSNPPSIEPSEGSNPILLRYQSLNERNQDFAGWIHIHNTIVDYPVMYTPDAPEKYLHRNFEGAYSLAGLPFLDVSYPPDSQGVNQLIYAHNMKSGQMFAILHQYYKDEYWDNYRTLSFDTLDSQREYEVLALIPVILGPMDKPSMMIFHSLNTLSEQSVDEINAYLEHYSKRLAGEVQLGDDLVTLVTCRKLTDSDRLLVVARRGADQKRP